MSWNNQDNNEGQGPWGPRRKDEDNNPQHEPRPNPWDGGRRPGGSGGGDGPDLDALLRRAQNRFQNGLGGGGRSLGLAVLMLALLWAATGFYRVQPEENAVILTFGKLTNTRTEPGLGYRLPWPIQQVVKVNVTFERRIEIGFRDGSTQGPRLRQTGGDQQAESLMLTGDENIIDIDFVVLWRISDAGKYLFQIRDPETTVKKVAESAMREVIGRTPIQKALTEGRGEIEGKTKELMQQMMDDYISGIAINDVQLQQVNPPAQVVDAFDDVQRARADKERMRNEAEAYRNDILPKARGDAQKLLQESEGYKEAAISKAKGEADRFLSVYKAYSTSKDVTSRRLYIETMQQILENSKKVIIDDKARGTGVLPYLPLATERKGTTP